RESLRLSITLCLPIRRLPAPLVLPYPTLFRSPGVPGQAGGVLVHPGQHLAPLVGGAAVQEEHRLPPGERGVLHVPERPGEPGQRSEEHTSELQSRENLVCRLLLAKKQIVVEYK